jgi:hypothetical protein
LNVPDRLTPRALAAYVEARGYRVSPLTNSVAVAQENAPIETKAYELLGPRRNRTVVMKGQDGCVSGREVALWCDGVDYASKKVAERRAAKNFGHRP